MHVIVQLSFTVLPNELATKRIRVSSSLALVYVEKHKINDTGKK